MCWTCFLIANRNGLTISSANEGVPSFGLIDRNTMSHGRIDLSTANCYTVFWLSTGESIARGLSVRTSRQPGRRNAKRGNPLPYDVPA